MIGRDGHSMVLPGESRRFSWRLPLLLSVSLVPAAKPKEERQVMVVSVAPAVRVAISEAFDLPPGAITIGQVSAVSCDTRTCTAQFLACTVLQTCFSPFQIVTGLKMMGFEHVFGERVDP